MKISEEVQAVLRMCTIESVRGLWHVGIAQGQLDRKLYLKVKEAFVALGGPWSRKHKAHVFPFDPTTLLAQGAESGQVHSAKKDDDFYPTPVAAGEQMLSMLGTNWSPDAWVLEPSAGDGALVKLLAPHVSVVAVEKNRELVKKVRQTPCGEGRFKVVLEEDFLSEDCGVAGMQVRGVMMNPPFSDCIAHVTKAFRLLGQGATGSRLSFGTVSTLVTVLPASYIDSKLKAWAALRDLLSSWCLPDTVPLPPGAFRDSGTNVQTVIVRARKGNNP